VASNTTTKQTLGSVDTSKVMRLIVIRMNRAVRMMKSKKDIQHFFDNHANDECEPNNEEHKLVSVGPGRDYLSFWMTTKP
jgi:hypothetical protein